MKGRSIETAPDRTLLTTIPIFAIGTFAWVPQLVVTRELEFWC
jgi:hypothetical protein